MKAISMGDACATCGADEWYAYKNRQCAPCARARALRRKAAIGIKYILYGLTQEAYDAMLVAQGGGCALCGSADRLCVDHCHDTGRVRGILCNKCNTGIGLLGDDAESVERAAKYMRM